MADLGEAGGLGRAVGTIHLECGHRERGDPEHGTGPKGQKGQLRGQCTTCYAKVGNCRQLEWACARDTTTALRPGHSSRATGA